MDSAPSRSAFGLPPVFPEVGTALRESRFSSSTFAYPDENKKRRLRQKTSSPAFPAPDDADTQMVEAEFPDAPAADEDPDEDAARSMHS